MLEGLVRMLAKSGGVGKVSRVTTPRMGLKPTSRTLIKAGGGAGL